MSTIAALRGLIAAGTITPQTEMSEIKYIGPHITAQLQAQQINDVNDLLTHVEQLNFNDLKEFLTTVTRNRHANQCSPRLRRRGVPRGGGRAGAVAAAAAAGRGRGGMQTRAQRAAAGAAAVAAVAATPVPASYHVREVNRSGFNTLRNLLAAAAVEWPGQYQYNPRLPTVHGVRDAPTAVCGCKTSQPVCAAQPGCRWETAGRGRGARSLCVPTTNNPGFEGIDGFSGQRRNARLRNQNLDFIAGWRVPDPYR